MVEVQDFSSRRGAIVPVLPSVHAMLAENSKHIASTSPPEHIIIWTQKMRKILMDINRRFFLAMDGKIVAGVFFYRIEGGNVFFEDVHVAWTYRNNSSVVDGFVQRLEYDASLKGATFFAGKNVRSDADQEILMAKGFERGLDENGYEKLGTLSQAAGALKARYGRSAL